MKLVLAFVLLCMPLVARADVRPYGDAGEWKLPPRPPQQYCQTFYQNGMAYTVCN